MAYDHPEIEPRWQRYWDEHQTFRATRRSGRPKRYVLDMFPYPSGSACTSAIPRATPRPTSWRATSACAASTCCTRWAGTRSACPPSSTRSRPGTHPAGTTAKNIATFRRQLKMLGFSYDWAREIDTTDPGYVRWTQWIFLQLFQRGLAYQATVPVNWCPALGTVLANEEVIDGKSERGGHPVDACRSASGCCGSPPTPIGSPRISSSSTGPRGRSPRSATGSAARRARRSTSGSTATRTRASPSSRRGPTR